MKRFIGALALAASQLCFAAPTVLADHLMDAHTPEAFMANIQGMINAQTYCYQAHTPCAAATTNAMGNPFNILSSTTATPQSRHLATYVAFTARLLGDDTAHLIQSKNNTALKNQLNGLFVNGIPLTFKPGGYFNSLPNSHYSVGFATQAIPNPQKAAQFYATLNQRYQTAFYQSEVKQHNIYNLNSLHNVPKGLRNSLSFRAYIAAYKTLRYCHQQHFICAIAFADKNGSTIAFLADTKMIPVSLMMATQKANLSALTGTSSVHLPTLKQKPGTALFINGKLVGGVGATFFYVGAKPKPWQQYDKMIEARFIQNFKHSR